MEYPFTDVFDIPTLTRLCERFSKLRGSAIALLDLAGNVHVATGWKEICTRFHRTCPGTASRCTESDTVLAGQLGQGMQYNIYRCRNGLVDVAVPVVVDGEHVGNFFTGQFLFEAPDVGYFRDQARQFGFEERAYLDALAKVPILNEGDTRSIVDFLVELTQVIGEMGMERLRTLRTEELARRDLERQVAVRTRELSTANGQLRRHGEQLRVMEQLQADFIIESDPFAMYRRMLGELLTLSDSPLGLLGEVLTDDAGEPYLKLYALTNVAWNEKTRQLYEQQQGQGFEFRNLDNLFGRVVTGGRAVISNDPQDDPRATGWPEGHPRLSGFMGIPVYHGDRLVGEIGLANREGGYDEELLRYLEPLANTCGQIIVARWEKEARKQAEEKYRSLVESTSDWLWEVDAQGRYTYASPRVLDLLGYAPAEVVGRTPFDFMPEDEAERTRNLFARRVAERRPIVALENRVLHKDGRQLVLETSGLPILGPRGNFRGYRGIDRDITERRQLAEERGRYTENLEREVRERTRELTRRSTELAASYRELEEISYSVSHDLRSPLRAIDGYVGLFRERYGNGLDAEGSRLLDTISASAAKMGRLIDSVIAYINATRFEIHHERVDMNRLVAESWTELAAQRGDKAYRFEAQDLPACRGDTRALRQVWRQLLANAIKFSQRREQPLIRVSANRIEGALCYAVTDNGVGFNQQHVGKLFVLFQRLHGMDEYQGVGSGLALVDRLIRKHGGSVEARGVLNGGATFRFTLPETEQ